MTPCFQLEDAVGRLKMIHAAGILHGAILPQNVIVTQEDPSTVVFIHPYPYRSIPKGGSEEDSWMYDTDEEIETLCHDVFYARYPHCLEGYDCNSFYS